MPLIKKEKIFMAASISGFAVFGLLYVFFGPRGDFFTIYPYQPESKYYLNKEFKDSDPFISKNPGLDDMLSGPIISEVDPLIGRISAPVNLVLFSGFECAFCYNQEKALSRIYDEYKDSISITWKDYPKPDENSLSYQAALAGRCAQAQGKFWTYHDLLFLNSGDLSEDKLFELSARAGLSEKRFKECFYEKEAKGLVDDNIIEANALGISGVPYLFINQKEIMGEIDHAELKQFIDLELRQAQKNGQKNH